MTNRQPPPQERYLQTRGGSSPVRTPFHSDGSCKRPSTIAATLLCAISIFLDEKERAIVVKCLKMSAWRLKKRKKKRFWWWHSCRPPLFLLPAKVNSPVRNLNCAALMGQGSQSKADPADGFHLQRTCLESTKTITWSRESQTRIRAKCKNKVDLHNS